MRSNERLRIAKFEPIFRRVEPVHSGGIVTRTVIGDLRHGRMARIRRTSGKTLEGESRHHDYKVDLVLPHDRFDELKLIFSGLWTVAPREIAIRHYRDVEAELKPVNNTFDTYYLDPNNPLDAPEDIFTWFDAKGEKKPIKAVPDISPNIYTAKGMQQLRRKAKFRGQTTENG